MNPTLELNFWTQLLGILALEIVAIVAIAFLAQTLTQSAFWRRTIWQISFVCVLLLAGAELTGVGRGVSIWLAGKPIPERTVSVRMIPMDEQFSVPPDAIEFPEPAFVPQKETPVARSIWWPGVLWIAGFGLIVARILFARVLFFVLCWRNREIDDLDLLRRVSELATRLGIRRRIHLLESSGLTSPVAFGIARLSIGLPRGFAHKFTAKQQDAMLTHELAHLAGRDPLWYLLADFTAAIFWWHPAIWFARRRLHSASEHAADEAAAILDNGPGILAECLVQLGQQLSRARSFGWLGVEGNGFRSHLGRRVERLLNLKEAKKEKLRGLPLFFAKTTFTIFFGGLVVFTSGWIQSGKEQQEKNLSTAVQKSWNRSFASMTLTALMEARSDSASSKNDGTVVTNFHLGTRIGKSIPQNGKFESAVLDGLFGGDLFMKQGESTKTAEELMAEVKEILPGIVFYENELEERPAKASGSSVLMHPTLPPKSVMSLDELPAETKNVLPYFLSQQLSQNKPTAHTNPGHISKGRQAIKAKLDRIRFNEVEFQGVSLGEVLKVLRSESKRRDSEHVGVNFLFNPNPSASVAPASDPTGAQFAPASTPIDLNEITIHISPPLEDVRLAEVLDSIVQVADKPIQYKIEDYAVVFSPRTAEATKLYTRVYKVDSERVGEALDQVSAGDLTSTNRQQELNVKVGKYLEAAGVEFGAPGNVNGKAVFFNVQDGKLMVRATLEDFEKIQRVVESLNHRPQVTIEARFVEINEAANRNLDWNKLLSKSGAQMVANSNPDFTMPDGMTNWPKAFPNVTLSNSISKNFSIVLTEPQTRILLRELEQKSGTDILSTPKVTTLSGRQAQVSVEDEVKVQPNPNASEVTLKTGPVLDVNAYVSPDGFSIQMPVVATVREIIQETRGIFQKKIPVAKIRQMSGTANIFDGQTLVLGEITDAQRILFVFVTATIIDPAGNRVNHEENMPFATTSVPKQPERK